MSWIGEKIKKINWKNLWLRLGTGLILLGVVVACGILGGYFWFALIAFFSSFALFEFYRVFGIHKSAEGIAGYACCAGFWVLLFFDKTEFVPMLAVGSFILIMAVYVLNFAKSDSSKALAAFAGLFYPMGLTSFLYLTRTMDDGNLIVWLTFVAAWGADVFAYIFGLLLGRHKMSPIVSPKKTWEGAIGGVVCGALLSGLYAYLVSPFFSQISYPFFTGLVLGAAGAVTSIFGDLTASAFKRNHNIKDYSNLIPGHGGVMDRFDSVIFVAPAVFFLAQLLIK